VKICALFKNGELLDRNDRTAIALLRKLGFPPDYPQFLLLYGRGEFQPSLVGLDDATSVVKQIIKPNLDFQLDAPAQIGSYHGGELMAANHCGKVLLEYRDRDPTEPPRVFTTLESLVVGLSPRTDNSHDRFFYNQAYCPSCTLRKHADGDDAPTTEDPIVRQVLAMMKANDIQVFSDASCLRVLSEILGFSVAFNGPNEIIIKFRYDARLRRLATLLEEGGWKLVREPLDLHLRLLEEEI
jgi:hypothetical protein